ncbi:MAG: DNA recombination protein RmuC [Proteobacteria bacterium]|nr:DNA recombination protein RmuC [Pseudomonadota bacterium]
MTCFYFNDTNNSAKLSVCTIEIGFMIDPFIIMLLFFLLVSLGTVVFLIFKNNQLKNELYQKRMDQALLLQKVQFFEIKENEHKDKEKTLDNKLKTLFDTAANESLIKNQSVFLQMAKTTFDNVYTQQKKDLEIKEEALKNLFDPMSKVLLSMDDKLKDLEKERLVAYVDLKTQVQGLLQTQKDLRNETSNLIKALRSPTTRGQWGELQLKRVVELAGMIERCDFVQQESTDDNRLRPDMIIHLPGKKNVIVDAKTPLSSYLKSIDSQNEEERARYLNEHAFHVKSHIKLLSQKSYWEQFDNSPEFVVMFIPSESLFSAALEKDPQLIEYGANERVIIATPTTLIALLRAIAYGWRQENIHDSIQTIVDLGQEFYKRFNIFGNYFSKLGRHINQSVDMYNQTLSSVENRLLPIVRRFQDVKSLKTDQEIANLSKIETTSKSPYAMEFSNIEEGNNDEKNIKN